MSTLCDWLKGLGSAALVVTIASGSVALADDDLMNILGGSPATTEAVAAATGPSQTATLLKKLIGSTTAEQNIFIGLFEKNDFEKSLFQWPAAFDGTAFAKSSNGRALHALLLFRGGLHVTALENLLTQANPRELKPELINWWRDAASINHPVWNLISVQWKPDWTDVFGIATEIRVLTRQLYNPDEVDRTTEVIKKTALDTRERAMLQWQLVLGYSLRDEAAQAGKILSSLMQVKNNPISTDLMTMTAARLLFQNGYLDASMKYYEKIPKSSDYYFDAQEEMAWAFVRKGEPQNTLAITKTLVNPAFASQLGPEPIFLRSLAQLKVCDYPGVQESLNMFRDRFKPRAKAMLEIQEGPKTGAVLRFIARTKEGRMKLTDLGNDGAVIPRFVTRDEMLNQLIQIEKAMDEEGKQAGLLYARSLSGGTAQVGFQASIEQLKQTVESRLHAARSATLNRVKSLADEEINEISGLLQKLHIVETEVLQQVSMAGRVAEASKGGKQDVKVGTTGSKSRDNIWFPFDGETWFDELSNYKVDIKKGCQARN